MEVAAHSTAASSLRVEDYLNDKFQSVADLDSIDALLAKLKEQQLALQTQLDIARQDARESEGRFASHKKSLREQALQHEARQIDIERRFKSVRESNASDGVVRELDNHFSKYRSIERAERYLQILHEVHDLEGKLESELKSDVGTALETYGRLKQIVNRVIAKQAAAEDGGPHLVNSLTISSHKLYRQLQLELESHLRKRLDQMNWPKRELKLIGDVVENFTKDFEMLLRLEEADLTAGPRQNMQPLTPLPFAVLVAPLAQRFRFHFYGDKPTNRLDKPEFFFNHILDLVDQYNGFLLDYSQPVLDARVAKNAALDAMYPDAISCFISALLPIVAAKCLSLLPQIKDQPQLMSHFMRELAAFDNSLQEQWAYTPYGNTPAEWKGLMWDILNKHNYFEPWLNIEKAFALSRYQKIQESSDSDSFDYDNSSRTRPTRGAVRVNDLLESVTEQYRSLSSFSHKMKFLLEIQIEIFDHYHARLTGAYQAYLANSHTMGRLVAGASAEDALGLKGLETLAKIFGSAEYLERKMSDWSDDVFFLELWQELEYRANENSRQDGTVGRDLQLAHIASKTSSTIRIDEENPGADIEAGSMFDETANAYRGLREKSRNEIIRALDINIRNSLQPYVRTNDWASLMDSVDLPLAASASLETFNQTSARLFGFLAKVVAPHTLGRMIQSTCRAIQDEVYDRLVLRHSFSSSGAKQLQTDIAAIAQQLDSVTGLSDESNKHLGRLNDVVTILTLPAGSSEHKRNNEDDGWGFDDDENTDENATATVTTPDEDTNQITLQMAERAIFADNASARQLLADIGIAELNEKEVRDIIRRSVGVSI